MNLATDSGELLINMITSKDVIGTLTLLDDFKQHMRDIQVGADYVLWISDPANLTRVHRSLIDNLGISPRALAIKRVLMSRTQKAVLLLQAMEIAIRRVHSCDNKDSGSQ